MGYRTIYVLQYFLEVIFFTCLEGVSAQGGGIYCIPMMNFPVYLNWGLFPLVGWYLREWMVVIPVPGTRYTVSSDVPPSRSVRSFQVTPHQTPTWSAVMVDNTSAAPRTRAMFHYGAGADPSRSRSAILLRGGILSRTYGPYRNIYLVYFAIFPYNIWSYLLWFPVIYTACNRLPRIRIVYPA